MAKHSRDNRPYLRPVTRLELSESNIKLRWIAIGLLLAVAVVSIGYGFSLALSTEPGWQPVHATSNTVNCSGDFVLMYDFGEKGINPTAQYKKLEILYTQLTERGYALFSPAAEGADNLHWLNTHVNETVTVAPELYKALEQICRSESRHPYMGPVVKLYDPLFLSATDEEAAVFDPAKDPELAEIARETGLWCADPDAVDLELLGNNQVRLKVSDGYRSFAEENGIESFLDLNWMTNAFVIDFIADGLEAQGFTSGYLTSYDGFTRNLDIRGNLYSVNFFDRQGSTVRMPGRLDYEGPASVVFLRDYPLSEEDRWHYYAYADGSVSHVFLDPSDGQGKTAVDSLMAYSDTLGCGEMVLKLAPVFIADQLDKDALAALSSEGLESLWYAGTTLCHTQPNAAVTLLPDSGGAEYTIE